MSASQTGSCAMGSVPQNVTDVMDNVRQVQLHVGPQSASMTLSTLSANLMHLGLVEISVSPSMIVAMEIVRLTVDFKSVVMNVSNLINQRELVVINVSPTQSSVPLNVQNVLKDTTPVDRQIVSSNVQNVTPILQKIHGIKDIMDIIMDTKNILPFLIFLFIYLFTLCTLKYNLLITATKFLTLIKFTLT